MKIENWSHRRIHKVDGIGVGRIRTFPFLLISFMIPSLMIQWKLGCRSQKQKQKQKQKNQPIAKPRIEHCHWFILSLLLVTPTMHFSPYCKQFCTSDSVGSIFSRSYCSTLLITTLTTTPSRMAMSPPPGKYFPSNVLACPHLQGICGGFNFYLGEISTNRKDYNRGLKY